MDIRLDYICEFEDRDAAIAEMTAIRKDFIALDNAICFFAEDIQKNNPAMARAVSIARTHLETSLQYAIKALCLKYEKKNGS